MPEQRDLQVRDAVQGEYTRTITSRLIEFTCQHCGKPSSREQFPGPKPRYCLLCLPTVEAEKNAERQKRHRERSKLALLAQQVPVTIPEKPQPTWKKAHPKARGEKHRH